MSGDDIPLLARIVAIADYADRHIAGMKTYPISGTILKGWQIQYLIQFVPYYG
ncbi:MAG: hypothetical protein ACLS9K_03415 [Lachnospira eligens]